jgi:hypothetical protein
MAALTEAALAEAALTEAALAEAALAETALAEAALAEAALAEAALAKAALAEAALAKAALTEAAPAEAAQLPATVNTCCWCTLFVFDNTPSLKSRIDSRVNTLVYPMPSLCYNLYSRWGGVGGGGNRGGDHSNFDVEFKFFKGNSIFYIYRSLSGTPFFFF